MAEPLGDSNALILPCRSKKKKRKQTENKQPSGFHAQQARKLSKSHQRKVRRIQEEEEKKEKRCQVVETLQKHVLEDNAYALLHSSGTLGHVATVREKLRRALQFKRAGLAVSSAIPLFRERTMKREKIKLPEQENVHSSDAVQADVEIHQTAANQDASLVNEVCVADNLSNGGLQVTRMREAKQVVLATKGQNILTAGSDLNCPKLIQDVLCHKQKFVVHVSRSEEVEKTRSTLPILMLEQEIMEAINDNPVVIICGETGCGKTTQVPQFLYEAGFGSCSCKQRSGMIGVTQPRRVAVLSTAKRISHELNLKLGREVGFQVRHDRLIGKNCHIKFMTDGILLREIQTDFLLRKYSVIVLDEAHERSLNTDILIGMLSRILPLRQSFYEEHCKAVQVGDVNNGSFISPLKLIIMSATLRIEDFVSNRKIFALPPPVLHVPTRQFPVTIHFSAKTELIDYVSRAYKKVCAIHKKLPPGGILVFLTGQREVHFLCRRLRKSFPKSRSAAVYTESCNSATKASIGGDRDHPDLNVDDIVKAVDGGRGVLGYITDDTCAEEVDGDYEPSDTDSDAESDRVDIVDPEPVHVLPLYAMLPAAAQLSVFDSVPEGSRLVVVATNVAETSITIPGIKYVVDCGRAKEKDYDHSNGAARYEVRWISKASAAQRAGRAGRTGPGHCYRLYSSAVFNDMFSDFSVPEINRAPIEGLVLLMKCMGISKVINFPLPMQPDRVSLMEAERCLLALSALDSKSGLPTTLGRAMATFPISPRHSRMLVCVMWAGVRNRVTAEASLLLAYATAVAAALSLESPFLRDIGIEGERTTRHTEVSNVLVESVEGTEGEDATIRKGLCHAAHAKFRSMSSDALSVATALRAYEMADNREVFCKTNFLHARTMHEMSKLRQQLMRLLFLQINDLCSSDGEGCEPMWCLNHASDVEALWLKANQKLTVEQNEILRQAICAGWADRVARRVSLNESMKLQDGRKHMKAVMYQSCAVEEFIFLHPSSSLSKIAPEFVVYNELLHTSKLYMRGVTIVESKWLVTHATALCTFSKPLVEPAPWYTASSDDVMCWISPSFGPHMWELPLQSISMKSGKHRTAVFACALLQGKVLLSFSSLQPYLAADPCIILKPEGCAHKRVSNLLHSLGKGSSAVDTCGKLKAVWDVQPQFLFHEILCWLQKKYHELLGKIWAQIKQEAELRSEESSGIKVIKH